MKGLVIPSREAKQTVVANAELKVYRDISIVPINRVLRGWPMRYLTLLLSFGATILSLNSAILAANPVLIRVQTKDAKSHVGELISKDVNETKVFDIELNTEVTISRRNILRTTSPLSEDAVAKAVGLPALVAWQMSKLPVRETSLGKIAKVSPTAIYFTLPKGKVKVGQIIAVFRNKGEILDPDTGKVLAVERPKIAELEVIEVADLFSKGKLIGNLETELVIGDEVELSGASERKVAVCPLYLGSGELTNVGMNLSEEITTLLVKRGTKVVERAAIANVLTELVVQNTILFDAKAAQKIGQLTGASHVVVGKIVQNRKLGNVYVRLVNVATGEIIYAASSSISLVNARVLDGMSEEAEQGRPLSPAGAHSSRGGAKVTMTDNAPNNWLLKRAYRGSKLWWDRDYMIKSISRDLSTGGTLLVRSKGDEDEWIKPGALSLDKPGSMFVVLRSHYLGKAEISEITISQFERDGWKNKGEALHTTYPNGEGWKWIAFQKDIPEGPVIVSLKTVRWPNRIPALFIFK